MDSQTEAFVDARHSAYLLHRCFCGSVRRENHESSAR